MGDLSRYLIKSKISFGGMASVYLAEDLVLNRDVAIKKVHPHLLERPETIKRFNNEAKIIASLSHENIITVFDYGEDNNERYIIMEFVDGYTLTDIVNKFGVIPNLVMMEIMVQILSGLKLAHSQGIYHRDIKPDNVMLDRKGCAKLMDFGIAYLVNQESITLTGAFVGSPSYISPEQVTGGKITEKTDLFSFGSLCYVCVTDVIPFDADNPNGILHKVVNKNQIPVYDINKVIISHLSDLIDCCLRKDFDKRLDAKQAIAKIKEFCSEYGVELGKERYLRFIANPDKYRKEEQMELFSILQKKGRDYYFQKQYLKVLRNFDQMRLFGKLSSEDQKIENRIKNRGIAVRFTFVFALCLIIACGTFFVFRQVIEYRRNVVSQKILENQEELRKEKYNDMAIIDMVGNDNIIDSGVLVNEVSIPDSKKDNKAVVNKNNKVPIKQNTVIGKILNKNLSVVNTDRVKNVNDEHAIIDTDTKEMYYQKEVEEQLYGYLYLKTNPPWVHFYVDNVLIGKTPQTGVIKLKSGKHTIKLIKVGFELILYDLTIITSDTLVEKVKLVPSVSE